MNDADLEMIALVEAGNLVAKGICPVCEEPVDCMDSRWDDMTIRVWRDGELVTERLADDPEERARYASMLGPSTVLEGFHDVCMEEPDEMRQSQSHALRAWRTWPTWKVGSAVRRGRELGRRMSTVDIEMACDCPLCKEEYDVTWAPGPGVREEPSCPKCRIPLIARSIRTIESDGE